MTPEKAIELLEGWQRQIIDGKPTFREIADVIRSLTLTDAAPTTSQQGDVAIIDWMDEQEAALRNAKEKESEAARKAQYREAAYWSGAKDTLEKGIASWRSRSSIDGDQL